MSADPAESRRERRDVMLSIATQSAQYSIATFLICKVIALDNGRTCRDLRGRLRIRRSLCSCHVLHLRKVDGGDERLLLDAYVTLGGLDGRVSEQLLHEAHVERLIVDLGCKRGAQVVGRNGAP